MGQSEVINFLKKSDEPLSSRQIAEGLKITNIRVCTIISQLIKYGEVSFIEIDRFEAQERLNYSVSRRLRLYYIAE